MTDEYGRGFAAGYRQGKESGLSESDRGGEVANLRQLVEYWRNQSDGQEPTLAVKCPHWSPGHITLRKGCTACEA